MRFREFRGVDSTGRGTGPVAVNAGHVSHVTRHRDGGAIVSFTNAVEDSVRLAESYEAVRDWLIGLSG